MTKKIWMNRGGRMLRIKKWTGGGIAAAPLFILPVGVLFQMSSQMSARVKSIKYQSKTNS